METITALLENLAAIPKLSPDIYLMVFYVLLVLGFPIGWGAAFQLYYGLRRWKFSRRQVHGPITKGVSLLLFAAFICALLFVQSLHLLAFMVTFLFGMMFGLYYQNERHRARAKARNKRNSEKAKFELLVQLRQQLGQGGK